MNGQIIIGKQIGGESSITKNGVVIKSNSTMTIKGSIGADSFRHINVEISILADDELLSSSIGDITFDDSLNNTINITGSKIDTISLYNVDYVESDEGFIISTIGSTTPIININTVSKKAEKGVVGGVSQTTIKN